MPVKRKAKAWPATESCRRHVAGAERAFNAAGAPAGAPAAGASGNAAPIATISVAAPGLNDPAGVALEP